MRIITLNLNGIRSAWNKGLLESVLHSGDGRSPETAWVAISIREEYSTLSALGFVVQRQALVNGDIDEMSVEKNGTTDTLYFNAAASLRRMRRRFGEDVR